MSTQSGTEEETDPSREELLTQVELLEEENRALYSSYTRAKQTQYRRTAFGLGGLGILAAIAGALIPTAQQVLLSLAGIGLFGSVLTFYLTPEQFIAADTGRDVYTALARNEQAMVSELGLTDHRVYVPTGDVERPVVLFVPQSREYVLPDEELLANTIVASNKADANGVAFHPSGASLFESFTQALSGSLSETIQPLGFQLTEALISQFELVDTAQAEVDEDGEGLTVTVSGSAYGAVTGFDHPVVSFIAVGLVQALDSPVVVEVSEVEADSTDYRVRFHIQDDA